MSEIKTNKVSPVGANGTVSLGDSGDTFTIPSGATFTNSGTMTNSGTATGFGKVLQVVTLQYNTLETHSAGASWQNTGLSLAITPSATSSKVLVLISASIGVNTYGFANVVRGTTNLNQGTGAGSRVTCTTGIYHGAASTGPDTITLLDSPSTTSATTYLLALYGYNGGSTFLNRDFNNTDGNHTARGSSSITLMEIAG